MVPSPFLPSEDGDEEEFRKTTSIHNHDMNGYEGDEGDDEEKMRWKGRRMESMGE